MKKTPVNIISGFLGSGKTTAIIQLLGQKTDEEQWAVVINEFGKITGESLLLNTSFNIMGEPIVNHPRVAIRCFYDNGLDSLVLGNFVLEKKA